MDSSKAGWVTTGYPGRYRCVLLALLIAWAMMKNRGSDNVDCNGQKSAGFMKDQRR